MSLDRYEKGLELEKLISRVFSDKGYYVVHNTKLKGRSGVEHQIDVYAEYKCPLHLSKVIVECKAYDKPINKEIVMKLIQEVNDLGVDRGILITTSYFTPDAISTAQGYNIDLWDFKKLNEILKDTRIEDIKVEFDTNVFHIQPQKSFEEAYKVAKRKVSGFLKRGKILESYLIFYPVFEFDVDLPIQKRSLLLKKPKEKVTNTKLIVDALANGLVTIDQEGFRLLFTLPPTELREEEIITFRELFEAGQINVPGLASILSCSEAKARKILQGLVIKGLVEQVKVGRSTYYTPVISVPDPHKLSSLSEAYEVKTGVPADGKPIREFITIKDAEKLIKIFWDLKINSYRLIYYPFYLFLTHDQRMIVVDALAGKLNEGKSFMFSYNLTDWIQVLRS